jgi:hypothetical protein
MLKIIAANNAMISCMLTIMGKISSGDVRENAPLFAMH